MAQQLDLKPHKFAMQKGVAVLVGIDPYLRLAKRLEDGTVQEVFVQKGKFFGAGGPELKKSEVPSWLADELKTVNPEVLVEVGLKVS